MKRFQIVSRARTGKHAASPAKPMEIEINEAAHLGSDSSLFTVGKWKRST